MVHVVYQTGSGQFSGHLQKKGLQEYVKSITQAVTFVHTLNHIPDPCISKFATLCFLTEALQRSLNWHLGQIGRKTAWVFWFPHYTDSLTTIPF